MLVEFNIFSVNEFKDIKCPRRISVAHCTPNTQDMDDYQVDHYNQQSTNSSKSICINSNKCYVFYQNANSDCANFTNEYF